MTSITNLENEIVSVLQQSLTALETKEIAKILRNKLNNQKIYKSIINPVLYRMKNSGALTKICEADGSKPKWSLIQH